MYSSLSLLTCDADVDADAVDDDDDDDDDDDGAIVDDVGKTEDCDGCDEMEPLALEDSSR